MDRAYVTTLCNGDGYVPGVEALGRSLAQSGTPYPKIAMLTSDVSDSARERLVGQGWQLRDIEPLRNPHGEGQRLFERFANTFTKLRAFALADVKKAVLLDADTIVIENVDDLFERPALAAAPDFLLPDHFNSGVMVIEPHPETFAHMQEVLFCAQSYDGGDQGFLNSFYPDWYAWPVEHRLPAGYNLHHFIYQFLHGHPGLASHIEGKVKILHYTLQKPWRSKPTLTGASAAWWDMYFGVHPEQQSSWKQRLHEAEDWSFERTMRAIVG